jgi:transcription elongation factor GreA
MTAELGRDVRFRDVRIGSEEGFRLVPTGQGDVHKRLLAVDSPVARALMGHGAGDTVSVHLPRGMRQLLITAVLP